MTYRKLSSEISIPKTRSIMVHKKYAKKSSHKSKSWSFAEGKNPTKSAKYF